MAPRAKKRAAGGDEPPSKRTKRQAVVETYDRPDAEPLDRPFEFGLGEPRPRDTWRISAWNICGLRAALKKTNDGLLRYVELEKPDILILTETKIDDSIMSKFVDSVPGYTAHFECSDKKGYAGVAVFVNNDLDLRFVDSVCRPGDYSICCGIPNVPDRGRAITVQLFDLAIVGCYVPNSGRGLVNLKYRTEKWDRAMQDYLGSISTPVVWCGDLNVAPDPIDVWRSSTNLKSAGHTPEERESFKQILAGGFFDAFRSLYPNLQQFTYWSTISRAVANDRGWRLDHFVLCDSIKSRLVDVIHRIHVRGSDHCPLLLLLKKADSKEDTNDVSEGPNVD